MNNSKGIMILVLVLCSIAGYAQEKNKDKSNGKTKKKAVSTAPRNEREWLKNEIDSLCSPKMKGRGYVMGGRDSALAYLERKFHSFGLRPAGNNNKYTQAFAYPVNTFPGKMTLTIDDQDLLPGEDFVIDPSSSGITVTDAEIKSINLGKIKDTAEQHEAFAACDNDHAYYLENYSVFCNRMGIRLDQLVAMLPKGCFLIAEDHKLSWSVSRHTMPATVFYVKESSLPKLKHLSAKVDEGFAMKENCENVLGLCPGACRDTYIIVASHYDHLGMMGDSLIFPGAGDGASGVALMLSLASYFSVHPAHYSILFIAFAGEEASLMGSEFFVWHPLVPLAQIKFVTDFSMVSDATDGITVVNGATYPDQMAMLDGLNEINNYVPKINVKGPAANGDHFHFADSGIPAVMIYSNGGNGFYHDIYDTPDMVSLTNVSSVAQLMVDFLKHL